MDEILDTHATVPSHVVYRGFEGETLLLNLDSGEYHGLNETGGRLLELMAGDAGSLRHAIERLAREYGVAVDEIEPGLVEFCRALAERGLLELRPAAR